MKTEETIYQNEGTQVVSKPTAQTTKKVATPQAATAKEQSIPTWQKVVIGGVAGIALGTGAVFAADKAGMIDPLLDKLGLGKEPTIDPAAEGEGVDEAGVDYTDEASAEAYVGATFTVDSELQVADLDDDLTFSEAFAAARSQVGAGGVFEWNGGVYGTYYADEWDEMSAEEKAEFGSHISYTASTVEPEIYADNLEVDIQIEHEVVVAEADVEADVEAYNDVDSEVQVLGVTEEVLADGSVVTVGQVEIDGQEVFLIDTDQDGHFDAAFTDANQDGTIAESEYVRLDEDTLSVESIDTTSDDYLASSGPDYTNDDFTLV
ncbi:MAG: hypothetical protein SNG49_02450 [Rikenellaceae bacterium]